MTAALSPSDRELAQGFVAMLPGGAKAEPVSLMQHLREVDPGPHLDWWHVGAMVEACQGVLDGDIERLAIQASPRVFKSRTVVQGTSSCRMRNEPRSKVFVCCADDGLVKYHSRHARAMARLGGLKLQEDSRAVELWQTTDGGVFKAATIRAAMLGFGWDLGIVDDPFRSRAEAQRGLAQTTTWEWYRDDFLSRKQARPEGGAPGQIILQQSLSKGDLIRRLLKWLDKDGLEDWHFLTLKGYAERSSMVLPGCVTAIPDPRAAGEPLCDDAGLMAPIAERRHSNPQLHRCVDQQDPVEDAGGGVFCRSWNRIERRPLAAPGRDGPFRSPLVRQGRGWDFNAGGADKTASARGGPTENERWRWEHAREYEPPAALLAQLVIDTAIDDGPGVEQVLPNEPAVGKAFSERLALDLRKLGITVHLASQREPKRSRSLQHAGKAAARCERCRQLIVPAEAVEMFQAQGVCKCPEPDGDGYGAVDFLEGDWNEPAGDRLHAFTGEPGGTDDLADAMAVIFNALATDPAPIVVAIPAFV